MSAVLRSPTSVQLVPFQDSTIATVGGPPAPTRAAVGLPIPARTALAVFKSATSVQALLSQISVTPNPELDGPVRPPTINAAVWVPPPTGANRVVATFATSVQLEPSYVSALTVVVIGEA